MTAAMTAPRRIRFGEKPEWEDRIRRHLDAARYAASFGPPEPHGAGSAWFVPLSLADYARLDALAPAARPRCLVPAAATIALCNDKAAFNRFLAESGFGAAVPTLPEGAPARFPVVLKRRIGAWGCQVRLVRDAADLAACAPLLSGGDWFLQRYVEGPTEYALHVLARDGALRWHCLVRNEARAEPYVQGRDRPPRARFAGEPCPDLPLFAAILARLGYSGTGCFDFKRDAGGPAIFEFNPRPGGSLMSEATAWMDAMGEALDLRELPR